MDRQRFLLPALALITVWRMALLPTMELSPDEALAVLYGQHAQSWYLEMGPLVPWLVKFSTWWLGVGEFGVRFFAPLCAFSVTVCLWRLCRGLFDPTTGAWAVVLLQVVPAFNLAAVTMTSCMIGLAAVMGMVLALRIGLHRPSRWHPAWGIAAICLLLAMLADWRNGLAYGCAAMALGVPKRRRHHLLSPGFGLITAAFIIASFMFIRWNLVNDWPVWEAGEAEPVWTLLPNALRWMLMASPVLLTLIVWSVERTWRLESRPPDVFFVIAFAVPYAALDFGWGPMERWPQAGFPVWLVLGMALLAHHSLMSLGVPTRQKIVLRTVATITGAILSMIVMRPDMLRYAGMKWPTQKQPQVRRTWRSFFTADPSSNMLGWRQSAKVLSGVLSDGSRGDWFVIANDWRIGVPLDCYLPHDLPMLRPTPEHPRVHVIQQVVRDNPLAIWPRYDTLRNGGSGFIGHNALYVTDGPEPMRPPASVRRDFERYKLLSIVRVMHGGHEVRTLKIFACYGYKPPDL